MTKNKYTKSAQSLLKNEEHAVAYLANEIHQEQMAGIIFFCSPQYDLDKITTSINKHFKCHVIGCTTAGEISDKYAMDGISAVSFSSEVFCLHPQLFKLSSNSIKDGITKLSAISASTSHLGDTTVGKSSAGFLLIDGLAMKEEKTIGMIHAALPTLPIVGGSAGDDLKFDQTYVFHKNKFHTNSGIFTFIETSLDFQTFQLQHFYPSEIEVVTTEVDSNQRIVKEIDGQKAASRYAELLNLSVDQLTPQVFSKNPLMLQVGENWYVRSVQKRNPDDSLTFYCAIENGLPLTIGKGMNISESLTIKTHQLLNDFSHIELTLGCDCILRKLEVIEQNKQHDIEKSFKNINFIGFNTYGEQINSIHVNQTLTGIVFGEKANE